VVAGSACVLGIFNLVTTILSSRRRRARTAAPKAQHPLQVVLDAKVRLVSLQPLGRSRSISVPAIADRAARSKPLQRARRRLCRSPRIPSKWRLDGVALFAELNQ